jgi:uncharacterized phiE125 gp8 family phage protein
VLSLSVTAGPQDEIYDLARAKQYLRVPHCAEDQDIVAFARAARLWAENQTERSLLRQTIRITTDEIPSCIRLPRPPVIQITSVKYYDANNSQQTVGSGNYYLVQDGLFGVLRFIQGYVIPPVYDRPDAIEIIYQAGYGDDFESVPDAVRAAVALYMLDLYERSSEREEAALRLLSTYCVHWV